MPELTLTSDVSDSAQQRGNPRGITPESPGALYYTFRQAALQDLAVHASTLGIRHQREVRPLEYDAVAPTDVRAWDRLDAVQDILSHPTFEGTFAEVAKGLPDLERLVSRVHAKTCSVKNFLDLLKVRASSRRAALRLFTDHCSSKGI